MDCCICQNEPQIIKPNGKIKNLKIKHNDGTPFYNCSICKEGKVCCWCYLKLNKTFMRDNDGYILCVICKTNKLEHPSGSWNED